MKKLTINGAILAFGLFICSFTGEGENPKHTCDAKNTNKCVIKYSDGSSVEGTGVAIVILPIVQK